MAYRFSRDAPGLRPFSIAGFTCYQANAFGPTAVNLVIFQAISMAQRIRVIRLRVCIQDKRRSILVRPDFLFMASADLLYRPKSTARKQTVELAQF